MTACPDTATIRVKQLAWVRYKPELYHARHNEQSIYQVHKDSLSGKGWQLDNMLGPFKTTFHPTLESAQIAAQVDWEKFIKAACS